MQKFLEDKREEIAELCRTHHVIRLAVFGSAVRDDFDPERSDVDFVVEFDAVDEMRYFDNLADLNQKLTGITGHRVDVLVRRWIRNPFFLQQVETDQRELYAA